MPVPEPADRSRYGGYRFPPEIIAHAVRLYFRFHLRFRDVQHLLAERGIIVSHETMRQWCTKFGATFAAGLRRRRVRASDKWHINEALLKIRGKKHWLWRAVDQDDIVLDILVQDRRDQRAAERFPRRVLVRRERHCAACGDHRQTRQLPTAIRRVLQAIRSELAEMAVAVSEQVEIVVS